jgi:hypothetical protein
MIAGVSTVSFIALLSLQPGLVAKQSAAAPSTTSPSAAKIASDAPPLSAAAERAVSARAKEWWSARERRDHQRMYDLYEPAYRKKVPFADFLKENAVRTRFDLGDIRVEAIVPETAERVRVKVNMETRPPGLPVARVTAEDVWVRVSGHWYKVHEDVRLPFPGNR